jgi:hypothetical protein
LLTTVTGTDSQKQAIAVFLDVCQNVYIKALEDIHKSHTSLTKHEKNVQEMEAKVKKGKGDEADLKTAEATLATETEKV